MVISISQKNKNNFWKKKIKSFYNVRELSQTFIEKKIDNYDYLKILSVRKNNFFYLTKFDVKYKKYYEYEKKTYNFIKKKIKISKNNIEEVVRYNQNNRFKLWWSIWI